MKSEVAMFFAPLVFNAAALCYLIRGRPMSTTPSHTPTTVSLADEEAVRRILVDTLGLWATVNNLTRLRPSRHERYRVTVFGGAPALGAASGSPRPWSERCGRSHRINDLGHR